MPIGDAAWRAFVADQPEATPFHHPAWAGVLGVTYGWRPFALVRRDDEGRIAAGLPIVEVNGLRGGRRWVSLPFTDVCPPLGATGGLAVELEQARRRAGVRRLEARGELGGPAASAEAAVIHRLELGPDPEQVFRRFHKSQVQRSVRKAEQEPSLTIRRADSERDVATHFYRLHLLTRWRQGVPVQPRRYFRLLWHQVLARGLGFALLVEREGVPVAGAVFLAWNGTVIYKYGASDPVYWKLRPNHLIFWNAIRWACENGYRVFDFGRTDLENQSLREFKSGWGATEEPLVYSWLGEGALDRHGKSLDLLGAAIRKSPPWLCRLLGELLYKHAA